MREKLKTYIDYLFAGAPQTAATAETKAEILQNTLDKYDDLIAEGKTPEAAYSLAVSGIGDLREFLNGGSYRPGQKTAPAAPASTIPTWVPSWMLAVAMMLYIACVVPVIWAGDIVSMFIMIAIATGLLVFRSNFLSTHKPRSGNSSKEEPEEISPLDSPRTKLRKSVNGLISAIALVAYLIVSFTTMAWHITWVIFVLSAAVQNIVKACFELAD